MNSFKAFLVSTLLLVFSSSSLAALMEAGFPPPGGVTYSPSGISPGHTGGFSWDFSNFDNSAYDELYYSAKYLEMYENAGLQNPMTYNAGLSNLAGGIAVWSNTVEFYNAQSLSYETLAGTFTLTATDTSNNALALTSATSLGLDSNLGGLLEVTGDFVVNWQFELDGTPALVWYDAASNHPSHNLTTGVGGSFYYSPPAAVPIPAAAWLFGSAMFGLIGIGRRRKA